MLVALWRPAARETIEQGLRAANITLKDSKQELKSRDPPKWRQSVLGVWRRHHKQPAVAALYESKLRIAERQCHQWVAMFPDMKLPVTVARWYTQPGFCHFLDQLELPYVGTLTDDAEITLQTGRERLTGFAARLTAEHLVATQAGQRPVFQRTTIQFKGTTATSSTYCRTHWIHNFGNVRLVISYRQAALADNPALYSTNRLPWQAAGIIRLRRHRWPVEV